MGKCNLRRCNYGFYSALTLCCQDSGWPLVAIGVNCLWFPSGSAGNQEVCKRLGNCIVCVIVERWKSISVIENVLKRNMRPSLNSIAFTNNFSRRQRLTIKLSESIADEHRSVHTRNSGPARNTFLSNGLRVSRWFVWFCSGWLIPRPSPMQRSVFLLCAWNLHFWTGLSEESEWLIPYTQHPSMTHIGLHNKRPKEEKGKKQVGADHPPSLYQKAFLVIKAWSLYWTCSNWLGAKHLF